MHFTARLEVLCLVDSGRPITKCRKESAIVLIRAEDRKTAFLRALELGKDLETEYRNERGETVRWVFEKVDTIWDLGQDLNEGEIGSVLSHCELDVPIDPAMQCNPAGHDPIFAGHP